jgi:hypothetical protein
LSAYGRSPDSRIILVPGLPALRGENSGVFWNSFPITVAGAVSGSHGLPFPINRSNSIVKDGQRIPYIVEEKKTQSCNFEDFSLGNSNEKACASFSAVPE